MENNTMDRSKIENLVTEGILKFIREEGEKKTDISIGGEPFVLKLDVNKNPTKKGIKVQFQPLRQPEEEEGVLGKTDVNTEQDDLAIDLLRKLNEGLKPYGIEADIDPDVPYRGVIGFYIHLSYFDRLIREALNIEDNGAEEI